MFIMVYILKGTLRNVAQAENLTVTLMFHQKRGIMQNEYKAKNCKETV